MSYLIPRFFRFFLTCSHDSDHSLIWTTPLQYFICHVWAYQQQSIFFHMLPVVKSWIMVYFRPVLHNCGTCKHIGPYFCGGITSSTLIFWNLPTGFACMCGLMVPRAEGMVHRRKDKHKYVENSLKWGNTKQVLGISSGKWVAPTHTVSQNLVVGLVWLK